MSQINFEAPDPRKLVHLVNDTSPESEGDYDEPTAAILLTQSVGWRLADDAESGEPDEDPNDDDSGE